MTKSRIALSKIDRSSRPKTKTDRSLYRSNGGPLQSREEQPAVAGPLAGGPID
jgi:hypothetical protein